jgi:uncharacterized protein DUF899
MRGGRHDRPPPRRRRLAATRRAKASAASARPSEFRVRSDRTLRFPPLSAGARLRLSPVPCPHRLIADHRIGTREEWQAAREQLLEREKEHARLGDGLARQRRDLPWVPVDKEYVREGGRVNLQHGATLDR